jgi:CubicO group peptidase (beta-lactamase class C family)
MKLAILLLTLLTALPLAADIRADAEKAFAQCRDLTSKKDEAGALAAADRATELWLLVAKESPSDPIPHLRLGSLDLECRINFAGFMEKGRLMGTIEAHLNRAIELDPKQWDAHYRLGILFYNVPSFLRRTDDAIRHLEQAIAIDPKRLDQPYFLLAELYVRKGEDEKARKVLGVGAKHFPKSDEIRKRLAETSASTGGGHSAAPAIDRVALIREAAERYVARPEIAGASIAVVHKGKVLLNEGFGLADVEHDVKADATTIYRIGSISKTFVAASVLKLADSGKLSLDDPITKWIDQAPATAKEINIRHLLAHTSGLQRDPVAGIQWIAQTLAAPRTSLPGEKTSYSNAGFALLGQIIEAASGESYSDFLAREVISPLGLVATSECDEKRIVAHRAEGYGWGGTSLVNDEPPVESPSLRFAGGMCSTAGDLAKWIGALKEKRVATWQRMTTPFTLKDGSAGAHGLGFRVLQKDDSKLISHNGAVNGFLGRVSHDLKRDVTVVVLINSEAGDPTELAGEIERLFDGE